jgi:hypothetical protein
MERIKTFDIKAEPTGRGIKKELSLLVDDTINGWLTEHPGIDNIRISHAARPDASFPGAFIIVIYEENKEVGEEVIPEPPAEEPESQRHRGRPPKVQ